MRSAAVPEGFCPYEIFEKASCKEYRLFRTVLSEYSTYLQAEKGIAESTRRGYAKAARDCFSLLAKRPEDFLLPPEWKWPDVDRRAIEIYLNHLRDGRGWQDSSLRQRASSLRAFFAFLQARGHIEANPIRSLHPPAPAREPAFPQGEEAAVRALFDRPPPGLKGARLLAVLELIYGGGLKPSQVYAIRSARPGSEEVRLTGGTGTIHLPLSRAGAARLGRYLEFRRAVVKNPRRAPLWVDDRGGPVSPARLAGAVKQAMEGAGLSGGGRELRQLSARHFRERGGDVRSLREFLGAKRLGNLDRYNSPGFQKMAAEFRRLHPRGNGQ